MSPEEFFMYLTIGLIVLVPVTARLYRYFTAGQVKRMLEQDFAQPAPGPETKGEEKR